MAVTYLGYGKNSVRFKNREPGDRYNLACVNLRNHMVAGNPERILLVVYSKIGTTNARVFRRPGMKIKGGNACVLQKFFWNDPLRQIRNDNVTFPVE